METVSRLHALIIIVFIVIITNMMLSCLHITCLNSCQLSYIPWAHNNPNAYYLDKHKSMYLFLIMKIDKRRENKFDLKIANKTF